MTPSGVAAADRAGHSWPSQAGLLVLRTAGLFLLLTFGWGKFTGYLQIVRAGRPLASSGLAPLIRQMGFPAPGWLGLYAALCESVASLLVAVGLLTRLAALFAALSMAGAFYVSLRLGEEPLRALLYFTIFAALALTGPGRFSLDHVLRRRNTQEAR